MSKQTGHPMSVGLILVTLVMLISALTPDADAIPAFARKYNMTCTTCHAPIPRLKPYGDEFAGNGFVLKDKDAPRYFVETGDRDLSLIRDLPFAIRLEGWMQYNSATERDFDFTSPYLLKLLSGGSLTENVAYYFYFFFDERGHVAGIEDAFIMFNDLFESELDVYIGQFQVSDPLFKRELRLTLEDYEVYRTRVGVSHANLTYDRGLMLTYGFPETGTDVIVEVTNGDGLVEADEFRVYDDDKYKAFVGRVSQDINDHIRVGGFGYYAKEGDYHTNEAWYLGPDASLAVGPLELNLQYLERHDTDPFLAGHSGGDYKTRGGFAEAILFPEATGSKWYGVALYNFVEIDEPMGGMISRYNTLAGHVGHLLRTNIRLAGEYRWDIEHEESRVGFGIISAF
ncbi:MAG: hypothetical protein Kow0074_02450 [Candidatus Zixiibacteriota bacterium]